MNIVQTPVGAGAVLGDRDELTLGQLDVDIPTQPFLREATADPPPRLDAEQLTRQIQALKIRPTVDPRALLDAVGRIPRRLVPVQRLPEEIRGSLEALRPPRRSLHGSKFSLQYFPGPMFRSPCANKFGYLSTPATRNASKLPFDAATRTLLLALGEQMAAPGGTPAESNVPAGFTYLGQFVDHDITLDISSSLDVATDANTIHNMRSPSLDLDSVYGRGPALDPFLYAVPSSGNPTAIKMQLGTNLASGPGGPGGPGGFGGLVVHTDRDVPRMLAEPHTAVLGDPRNDENLIVVQFHHAMLRFHNAVVDFLLLSGFAGDIFVEAKRIVTHHYQWAVVHDFLGRICGTSAVQAAIAGVNAPIGSAFRMPVEFAVAAYRFGHSMVRDVYWLSFVQPNATLDQVFAFNRVPHLPVRSNWVVDFNAFFETGIPVPVFNKATQIDSALANGLASLPGFTGLMANLAQRNLLRGLALGLPSGQAMAAQLGVPTLTSAELTAGLKASEVDVLHQHRGLLLRRTPLWYYVLREAKVKEGGNRLGKLGGRIVAETFVRMLKRDADAYLHASFAPFLPSTTPGDFTFADLIKFSGVHAP